MTECSFSKPTILVDLKKCRIRIHKSTLHSIGDPDHILLLVNPKELTLAILSSDNSDPRAHQIIKVSPSNQKCIELYSRSLVQNLLNLCSYWQNDQSYRLYGEIILNEGVAQFHMDEFVLLSRAKS